VFSVILLSGNQAGKVRRRTMNGFQHILLYSNGEKGTTATFKRVLELAQEFRAKLTIVDVVDLSPSVIQWILRSPAHVEARAIAESNARRRLERLVVSARERGVDATADVLFGKPFAELIRTVLKQNCDLVVKMASGGGGIRERLLGSTALHLMRKCPCPVLVVRPKRRLQFARILVPIDIRPEDDFANTVNPKLMEIALSLAKLEDSELHLFHAWEPYGGTLLTSGRTRIPKDMVKEYLKSTEKAHRERFEEFLSRYSFDQLKHRIHFVRGEARTLIPQLVSRHRMNLVVMGTITNLGFAGYLIGSTAEEVLPQLNCSMLTVKPDGFITPLKVE
jgi:nucleotide-binding universal stress UspA family protein